MATIAQYADYGWIIEKDFISDAVPVERMGKDFVPVKVVGPGRIDPAIEAKLVAGEGRRFQLFDDDGTLYYEGRFLGEDEFGPLDDYGTPNAGAVTIKYLKDTGEWEEI